MKIARASGPGSDSVDLTNCDREPIHQLGRVQSYGALLAVTTDWIVQHASENLGDILGIDHGDAIGRRLQELIVHDAFERMRKSMHLTDTPDGVVRLFGVTVLNDNRSFDVSLHGSGRHMIVEFEPRSVLRGSDVMSEVYPHILQLRGCVDLETLARRATVALHKLSGFDSVMLYQFQADKSGKVLAETRSDGGQKYLGLMFPASDIPAQARALYKRSLLRLISDVDDPGSAICPPQTVDGTPVDLSLSVTRAVSPIHIEYLKNMGVSASMSVSIMKDGELWGLFACHHHSPCYIDYERRTAFEMFAHMFSYELTRFEDGQRKIAEVNTNRLQSRLMTHMVDGQELAESLLAVSDDIQSVLPHDGLCLYDGESPTCIGATTSAEEFRSIARFLDRSIGSQNYHTDCLGNVHEPARDYEDRIAGLLAIPISKRPRDYLVLFRRPINDTVSWAGDPNKPVTVGPNGVRLTPRKSFDVWKEAATGRSAPWTTQEVHAANLLRTVLLEVFLKVTDAANLERQRAQEQQELLISELNHRVRNILNLMRGLLSQSRASAATLEEFTANLDGRIHALARAHDQLTADHWEPASLRELILCEFAAYANGKSERVNVTGPDALVKPQAYTTLALVLHEMATNSVKYGALCDSGGRVDIHISRDNAGGLLIDWLERGGPPVSPPERRGFGTVIIETSIPHELKGDSRIHYKMTGVEAHFRLPPHILAGLIETVAAAPQTPAPVKQEATATDFGGPALVLEDSLIIAMDAAAMLEDMGASPVEIASSVADAMAWLETVTPNHAVLDVNLGDEQSLPVAERLHALGVPFVLATGYGDNQALVETYPPCEIVQKPFTDAALQSAFERLADSKPKG
ncbi:HWE histidine kinase domain-containing protein [Sagittula stellata]|uniref:histidine kinase n=1 Tax=Sagittula stellata (strain ATCC 700073 / DSM 11524 / E-37) TaxID=388399 RepID=A3K9F1_SAGS3|nr:HWE histidine kinase domain-containing protein [Sagittula stellata]EBA06095.1 Bacteriophytochrome (light-regulated signal transduction histidine kinase), PhyB5 [Sagittula stellata E-37]